MYRKITHSIIIWAFLGGIIQFNLSGQNKVSFNGYITEMPSYSWMKNNDTSNSYKDNLIHNRLNFAWYPTDHLNFAIEARNRLIHGESMELTYNYATQLDNDQGYMDLSVNYASSNNYVLNTIIDRLWGEYSNKSFQIRVGRQRINWGQSLVWNPNDIFNAYSYFDFDYIEKPGSDGVRIQYYTGITSLVEIASKLDRDNDLTSAIKYRFNAIGYDFQVIGGWFDDEEWMLGTGWSGHILDAGFYGELSWFLPENETSILVSSIGANYTFNNSLFLQAEILYSSNLKNPGNFLNLYYGESSVKNLSLTEWTYFMSVSYPITPLLNSSFSAMSFPVIEAIYVGPSFDYSLSDQFSLSLIAQLFSGKIYNQNFMSLSSFLRFKWNF